MGKIKFIASEFFRSIRRSLFKNIMLMLMFSISLLMTVIMSSYYLDLGDRYAKLDGTGKDTLWCNMDYLTTNDDIVSSFYSVAGCRNMMDYYDEIHSLTDNTLISINLVQSLDIPKEAMNELLSSSGYTGPDKFPGYFAYDGNFSEKDKFYDLTSVQLDIGAWNMYGLRTQDGEGFNEQNMTLNDISSPLPIVLGSSYKGIIKMGTEMTVSYWGYEYRCRVVGILEEGAMIPEIRMSGSGFSDPCLLDKSIIFPLGIKVTASTDKVEEIDKFANLAYLGFQNGIALVKDGELNNYVRILFDKAEKYGVIPVHLEGSSLGTDIFRKESSDGVKIIFILTIILLCFTFYGLGVVFYDKIMSNKRVYGIYLMNGCSVSMILISYLVEIALILLPSIFICRYILMELGNWDFRENVILNFMYVFTLTVFFAGTVLITALLRGVDTEQLIRQKD